MYESTPNEGRYTNLKQVVSAARSSQPSNDLSSLKRQPRQISEAYKSLKATQQLLAPDPNTDYIENYNMRKMLLKEAEGAHRDQFNRTVSSSRGKSLFSETIGKKYSPYMSK